MATWSDVTSWNVLLPGFFLFFTEFSRRVRQSYLAGRKRSSAVANTKFDLCDANGGGETAKAAIKKKERIRKRERERKRFGGDRRHFADCFSVFSGFCFFLLGNLDIVNGNLKLILGLIWSLIVHYQIGRSKFPPKKLMLAWLRVRLLKKNFSFSIFLTIVFGESTIKFTGHGSYRN